MAHEGSSDVESDSSDSVDDDQNDLFKALDFDIDRINAINWYAVFEILKSAGPHFAICFIKSILNGWRTSS
eukprot:4271436-Karenia_brevis.AAC.1